MQLATRRIMTCVVLIILGVIFVIDGAPSLAQPPNPVVTENALAGNPASEWDVIGEGDPTLQGFTTDISYNVGQTVEFKITAPGPYALYIYRMGYYNGAGARLVATIPSGSTTSPAQPACITDPVTGLYDCGNWSVTATWPIPANAVSGVYFAKALPNGQALNINNGSHIAWVVRDDARQSDILFQTQDTTWQAYNRYGTGSLYAWLGPGTSPGLNPDRAHKVSYNRPITTREYAPEDWVFNSEYPMIRWLERNGYDVTYISGVDAHRYPAELLDPTILLFIGHDEYWSQAQRDNVEAALAAGKHLAFFTGNEIFWRIRYENSIDGNNTPLRTMVGYKDSHNDEIWPEGIDPVDYTGTWRDPRIDDWEPDPENRLVGQIFTVNCCSYPIQVPSEYSNLRFWRNTSIATLLPGTQATLTQSTLGYEWDEALDNNDRPAGLFKMSSTTHLVDQKLLDYSSDFGPEIATHNLTMYKAPSGALVFGAGTIQWSWGLDGNHDRGETSPSADMQQATVNLFADMGNVQPETLQAGLIAATQSTDATAPTSTITSPSNGATVQMPVTVTGTAADSGGGVVAGIEISTDNGVTWRWATGTTNWTYVFSPSTPGIYVLRTRAVDDSGNLEVPSTTVTVTVEEGACPCSLWDNSFVPLNPNVDDGSGLEIGVRFKASESGFISAIRFYKGVQNTGTHVGSLWTEGGTLLSQVTFTNETASGWQTMYLPSPVAITANTTYVASYHAPTGVHAETINYFSAGDWTRGPLTAFGAANGGNGVYAYSASPVFPTSVGGSYWNYWVDVLFVTEVVPDTTPPTVTSVIPNNGAIGVSVGSNVSATFSEPMIGATINGTSFELRDSLNNLIPAVVTYDVGGQTATLNPSSPLEYNATYTATITTAVTDLAGLPLGANEVWSFTTEVSPPPPPDEGPGGPILVVSSALNPFGRYYAEILRAEGLNAFFVTDITFVDAGLLSAYDVVILGEMPLDSTQASMFATWVNNGGNLIAMRPDLDLAGLLGLTSVGTTLSDAWLLVNTTVGTPGEGIVNETIQFHGTADRYTLNGASALAWLYSTSAAATANPAVTMRSVGLNGGQAAAFTYDLAKSVVYTRQGNPTLAGVNTDFPITGNDTLRANDMFYPDWIDLNKAQIPTADEQQRLLANMILDMNADKKPLPRFWYLPRGERIVLLMTGDDHSSTSGTLNFFNYYRTQGLPGCSVEDWECIRATSYIYIDSGLTPAEAFQAEQDGFEVSIHPFGTACTNWDPATAATAIANEISAWQAKYALNRSPASNRNHCVTWTDFSTMAEASLANGIRLDTNYYYWPGAWLLDRPGYFNGSGLPMRFAQDNGQLIDVYQALTQLTDESQQTLGTHFQTLINNANDPTKHYIGVITANMHTDGALSYGANTLVPMAQGNGIPVVSAYQMLTWLDGRNGSEFNNISWAGDQLTFDIAQASGARGLRAMLPAQGIAGPLVNLTRNGLLIPYTYETFKGVQYVTFDAENGAYVADYSVDSTGPVISNVTATVAPNNDVTITWTTNELSDSTVLFGTDPGTLSSSENNPLNTTAHSVTLFGLPLNTTFHYRVVSTDLSANTSTSPEPPALPLTFTTNLPSVGDTTTADFSNGTGGCTVWTIGDGAVVLSSIAASEFNGTVLPAGWVERSAPWNTGGSATVGSGALSVDGQRVSTGSPYSADLTLEFVATFTSQAFQNGGFGGSNLIAGDFSEVYNNGPWAMFSTQNGGGLSARLNTPGGNADYAIPNGASYLGSPHLYRVEWTATGFNFYIDGVLIHTSPLTVATPMYPAFSDFFTVTPLIVDWARVTPYNSPCTFTSRVFGSSTPSDWAEISWISTEPAGTAITMRVRTGETVVPDGSWSAWQPVTNGATVGVNSRYIQYEATLSTTDPFVTPVLELVSIEYNAGPDVTPPTIISRSPVQSATSVPVGTSVVVGFDELLDPASVTGAFTLRAQGAPSDVPATVTYSSVLATVTIDPDADLAFATTYTVTVAASVADLAGNPLGAPDTWTFTTEDAPPISLTDTTVVDFGAGSGDCVVWPSGDGAVSLAASLSDEFSGAALDPVWTVSNWQGLFNTPSATVSGGSVAVNDVLLATSTFYEAGHVFEARATFSADTFQHLGFAYDFNPTPQSWVMFSTGGSVDTIYARVNQNGSTAEVAIPGSFAYIGTPHVYRIEWLSNLVTFYVDGAQVYQLVVTLPGTDPTTSMRPMFSDFNNSAGEATLDLVVDWMRMSPVASPCTFTSRVFDGGGAGTWGLMSWQSTEPTGTAIAMEVRSGDTATPDGSWSGWTAISNNASIGASARYAQYRATLSTSDPIYSPELQLVELAFNAGSNTAPVAVDDAYSTDEDSPLTVDAATGVLANDTDAETDPLTAVLVTDVTNGTLTLNSDGSFTYTPDADFNGTDTFIYKANDGAIDSADATVTITVNPINDAPVAVDDTYTTDEDLALDVDIATGVLANDTDVELDTLEATVVTDVTNGTLLLALDGSFTYTPNANFNGTDTFTYIVNDGTEDSTEATVTITVEPVNDPPVAVDDTYATEEDVELIVDALTGVLANDGDVDLDPLTAVLVTDVTNGTLLLALDGSFTYTPNTGFNGSDSFTYNANDSLLDSNIATVTINVGAVNDPPVAVDDSYSTDEDTPLTVAVPGVLGNDTDAETNPLTAALVDDVTNGTLTLNANGSFTYTPNADFNGADTFTYLANDGTANSAAPATVTITVNPVNDAPVAVDDSYSTDEDTPLTVAVPGVLGNDTDAETNPLTAVLVDDVTNGTLTLNSDGSFTYTPNANFNGTDTFTYKANDTLADSNVVTVTITVNPVNDAPVAGDNGYDVNEDALLTIAAPGILANDTDVEGSALTAQLVATTTNGTLNLNADGSFTYTPAANFNGSDSFTYRASDGLLLSNVANVTITVNAVNDAPVAVDDGYSTDEDTPLTVAVPGVLGNDTDAETNPLTAVLVDDVTNGTLILNANGSFTYTPNANFNGTDTFTYRANDGTANSAAPATVTITVNPVNDAPVAVDDGYSTNEDVALVVNIATGVLANDSDVDLDTLTAELVTNVTNGTLALAADGSFTYTPNAGFNGSDSFTYNASDSVLDSNVATVTINVGAVNDAPVAVDDAYSTNEDVALVVNVATGVLANDIDADLDTLSAVLEVGPINGVLNLNADGSFTYTPNANFNGSDSFTYRASDGLLLSNVATVTITVNPVNDAPVAVDDSYSTDEDTPLTVAVPGVLANDTDAETNPLTAVLVDDVTNGTLILNANGSFTYTPNANFNGTDTFTYRANDGTANSAAPAMVTITVNPVNDAPVAVDDSYSTDEDTLLTVAVPGVLGNDTDAETNPLTAALVDDVTNGTLTLNANGSFTYTPNANFNGTDTFTYLANDGTANSAAPATVTITVNPVNDAPVATADAYSTDEDTPLNVAAPGVLGNDTDPETDPLTAIKVSDPANGAVTLNSDGSFIYTPAADFNGTDSFTYKANDTLADSNVVTVTITVNPVNDAPVATADAYSTDEDTPLNVAAPGVLGNDTDLETDPLTAIKVSDPANGAVTLNSDGSFTYTPAANFNGSDSFTYKANDTLADSNVVTVTITVNPVNDAPVAADNGYNVNEDAVLTIAAPGILANDTDVEGSALTAQLVATTTNGTLSLNANGGFTYTPNTNFNGSDSFTYRANDGTADSNIATVSITVNPVNDAPVAVNDSYATNEDVALVINAATGVLVNDTDVDLDPLSAVLDVGPTNGVLTLNPDGSFTYTPAANFNGSDSFTYRANDGTADSNVATVTITVNPVNDAPLAVNDAYATDEDVVLNVPADGVLTNDSDADGNPLNALLAVGPTNGVLTLNANGSFTYTPAANFNGSDSFTYRANDGTADSNVATVTITVNPVNDAPVAADNGYNVNEDGVLNITAPGILANDTDVEGSALTAQLVATTTNGTLSLNADGAFTYTPAANFNGSDSFTYRASDGTLLSNIATVSITVNPVNDAPVAVNNGYNVNEDAVISVDAPGILANDTDIDLDPLTAVLATGPTNGVLNLNSDGSFTYTPNANFNGSDSFTYSANDGTADSNIATVTITVNPVNDAPVAVGDAYTTDEDVALNVPADGVLTNDSDVDGNPLTAVLVTGPASGSLLLNPDGSFTYTPAANFNGSVNFTYRANDGIANSNIATVTITVNPVNDAPVAVSDAYSTDEDVALNVAALGVLDNDTDIDGNPLTAIKVTDPSSGTVTVNADGSFIYTPNANFNGSDSFTYRANDGTADSNIATVTITVNAVNDAPVAVDDSYSTDEDVVLNIPASGVLGNDSDTEASPLTAQVVDAPNNGGLTLNTDGSFTYTPNANFNGSDSFTYVASDSVADSNVATVTITVNPVNDAPIAVNDGYSTDEDVALIVPATGVLGNDTDVDLDLLTAVLVSTTSNGTLLLNSDGSFTYTPDTDYLGVDTFTYRANDGTVNSNIATVTISIGGVNDAPVAVDDSYSTNEDVVLTVLVPGVLGNDSDVDLDPLTAQVVDTPDHGSLTLNPNGSFTYTPNANYNGPDSFTYVASDGLLTSNVATVAITVNPVNDAPVAQNNGYNVNEDAVLTIAAPGILANDNDVEGSTLTAQLVATTTNGTLSLNANGGFTYTPNSNYNGPDSFTYRASDGSLLSNVATVTITVNPVNDAPVAVADSYTTDEDTQLSIAAPGVLGNDTDIDGNPLSAVLAAGPAHGSLTLNPNGSFTYTPNADFNGSDSFTYRANDGSVNSPVATVSITVDPVNDPPVAVNDGYTTNEDTALTVPAVGVLTNDSDIDGNPLNAALVSGPAHGSLTLNPDGSFTYTPSANYNGSDSFTYRANDGAADSNVATVTITIDPVNDAPVAVNNSYSTNEDTALNIAAPGVLGNDTDVDGNPLTAILSTGPAHGSLTLNPNGSFTYTPNADYNGSDSFSYRANDGVLNSNVATVNITVNAVNDPPVAVNNSYSTDEDTALNVTAPGVLGNDSDIEGSALMAVLAAGPTHGSLTLNPNGSFTYTPNANYNGSDSFTYRASDGQLQSNIATVTITVNPINDAPVAVDDSYSMTEDTTLIEPNPGVLTNDSDVDGNSLTVQLVAPPSFGSLTLTITGGFTYTPLPDFNGSDSFTYRATDGSLQSNVATVFISVGNATEIPDANNDSYSTNEDTVLNVTAPGVLGNDVDGDGLPLTAILVSGPAHGGLTLNLNGSFTYTPSTNYNGPDSFTYRADNGTFTSNIATVSITVNAVNDAPTAGADAYATDEDTPLIVAAPGVLGNDTDVENSALSAAVVANPIHGSLALNADGGFTYTPNANYNGPDSFTYRASDGSLQSNVATVSITVNPVNDAPVAVDDSYTASEDTALVIAAPGVLVNDSDVDGNSLTVVLDIGPANGSLTLNPNGSFTYTPNTDYLGSDSFTYHANDGTVDSNVATVSITVSPLSPPEFFVLNNGFEIPGLTLTRAANWDATASSNAKRKCNKDKDGDGTADKLFANSGECSLQVRGQATLTSKATQGFAFINFDLGDTVEMSAFIRANNLVGDGQIALIIDHVEGTKDKLKIFVPTGTYDYVLQTVSLVTTGTPIDMKIQIKLGTGAGKYWVDDIELIGFDTSARSTTLPVPDVLPVPDAAAPGWRG